MLGDIARPHPGFKKLLSCCLLRGAQLLTHDIHGLDQGALRIVTI